MIVAITLIGTAAASFLAGAAAGIIIVVVTAGIRREERRHHSLVPRAPGRLSRGTRLLTGLHVRLPNASDPPTADRDQPDALAGDADGTAARWPALPGDLTGNGPGRAVISPPHPPARRPPGSGQQPAGHLRCQPSMIRRASCIPVCSTTRG